MGRMWQKLCFHVWKAEQNKMKVWTDANIQPFSFSPCVLNENQRTQEKHDSRVQFKLGTNAKKLQSLRLMSDKEQRRTCDVLSER